MLDHTQALLERPKQKPVTDQLEPVTNNESANKTELDKSLQLLCPKFRRYGTFCQSTNTCCLFHEFPLDFQQQIEENSLEDLMKLYSIIKTNDNDVYIWKYLLPIIIERSNRPENIIILLGLVVDIIHINIHEDKTPLISLIIDAFERLNFPFSLSIPMIYNTAQSRVNDEDKKNLLADILLSILAEKNMNISDNWTTILKLTNNRSNIDNGVLQNVIYKALKDSVHPCILISIYNDILIHINNYQLNSISDAIFQRYTNCLKSFKFDKEVDDLVNRKKQAKIEIAKENNDTFVGVSKIPINNSIPPNGPIHPIMDKPNTLPPINLPMVNPTLIPPLVPPNPTLVPPYRPPFIPNNGRGRGRNKKGRGHYNNIQQRGPPPPFNAPGTSGQIRPYQNQQFHYMQGQGHNHNNNNSKLLQFLHLVLGCLVYLGNRFEIDDKIVQLLID